MRSNLSFALTLVIACGGGAAHAPPPPSAPGQSLQAGAVATTGVPPAQPSPGPLEVTVKLTTEVADSTHPTEFQRARLVGHYSTPNGKIGFILDRTSEPTRIRFDGSQYVLELTAQRASRGALEYVAANVWMRIDEQTGHVVLFQGPSMKEAGPVVRDADARPLPPLIP
jgi:hypothetical protein